MALPSGAAVLLTEPAGTCSFLAVLIPDDILLEPAEKLRNIPVLEGSGSGAASVVLWFFAAILPSGNRTIWGRLGQNLRLSKCEVSGWDTCPCPSGACTVPTIPSACGLWAACQSP